MSQYSASLPQSLRRCTKLMPKRPSNNQKPKQNKTKSDALTLNKHNGCWANPSAPTALALRSYCSPLFHNCNDLNDLRFCPAITHYSHSNSLWYRDPMPESKVAQCLAPLPRLHFRKQLKPYPTATVCCLDPLDRASFRPGQYHNLDISRNN